MKKLTGFVFIAMLALFCAMAGAAFLSDESVSERERRALAERPKLDAETYLSGAYYRAWDDYLADHVPQRLFFIELARKLKDFRGIVREAMLIEAPADIGIAPARGGEDGAATEDAASDAATRDESAKRQTLISLRDRVLEVYADDAAARARYADAVNRCAKSAPAGMRVYSMLIPMRIEFEEERYRREADSQKDAISEAYGAYDARVEKVDAYAWLERHKSEYVYFRTDHHWTALGAYYGMLAFAETAGFEPVALNAYTEKALPNFLGSLYRLAPSDELAEYPDILSYYLKNGRNNRTDVYYYDESGVLWSYKNRMIDTAYAKESPDGIGVFLGGDSPFLRVDGDGPEDRVLAVVKDSYGNAFVPWLAPYFGGILCVDPRSYKEDFAAMLAENGVTDLLILDYAKILMMPEYADALSGLFPDADAEGAAAE
ncbi:MAG: hypothetical protein LBP30_00685 [Clostridiales Family XIII bacterium]|jgi:hypothetical protein|nr:hypothetical protein [Clostridiales Family XIII bacterium]